MIRIYSRCSTDDQDLASQKHQLEAWVRGYGGKQACVWYDEAGVSGDAQHRPQFAKLLQDARKGDTVLTYALDRLSREGIVAVLSVVKNFEGKGIRLVSISEPWADSSNPVSEVVIAVMAWSAQQEKKRIKARQKAGIEAAKAAGKKWGGRKKGTMQVRTPEIDAQVRKMHRENVPITAIARITKISRPTIYAILNDAQP